MAPNQSIMIDQTILMSLLRNMAEKVNLKQQFDELTKEAEFKPCLLTTSRYILILKFLQDTQPTIAQQKIEELIKLFEEQCKVSCIVNEYEDQTMSISIGDLSIFEEPSFDSSFQENEIPTQTKK